MKLTLMFSETEMLDIKLLARSRGIAIDDYDRTTTMLGLLVRAELDKIKPQPAEGKAAQ